LNSRIVAADFFLLFRALRTIFFLALLRRDDAPSPNARYRKQEAATRIDEDGRRRRQGNEFIGGGMIVCRLVRSRFAACARKAITKKNK